MSETIKLFCWVIDTPTTHIFPVKVESDEIWGGMKDAIKEKEKNKFADIDAADLDLWKATIDPSQRSLLESQDFLKKFTAENTLDPIRSLSTDLKVPLPDGFINLIIVRRPPATISQSLSDNSKLSAANIKRQRPDSPLETDRKKRQRESLRLSIEEIQSMKHLHERIYMLSEEPTEYSAPNEVIELPFPSVNEIPPHFSLLDEGKISYLGRERFSDIWKTFETIKNNPRQCQAIYLYGSKGFGKSYILAAFACLLVRRGTRIVYLPDCHAWLFNPLIYLRNALVFAFINAESFLLNEVLDCDDLESLANFCAQYRSRGQLCFIVDQLNALDPEVMAQDVVSNMDKDSLRKLLHCMSSRHILISSASANHKTFQYMAQRDAGEEKIPLIGGMTLSEMSFWWKHHNFVAFSDLDKQRVEDLTGCIPLLLKPFVIHREETLKSLEPQIWGDRVLESVRKQTIDFAKAKKEQLQRSIFCDEFVDQMRKCLLGVQIAGSGPHMDHCYFYIGHDNNGHYSCGLARQAITEFFRLNAEESIFLGDEWYDTLIAFKNNPSVIGFTVEQMVISKIASAGLCSDKFQIPAAKIFAFETPTTRLSIDRRHTYYVPVRFNLKAIDLLFASIDPKTKTAHIVPIQITTIAKEQTKDSEAAFFADKDAWLRGLEDFKVKITFLWIHHGQHVRYEVEQRQKELRSRTFEINFPEYEVFWVSIEQIDTELAKTLVGIQY